MKPTLLRAAAIAAIVIAGAAGYRIGMTRAPAPVASPVQEKKVLYWHDPMNPGQRFDKPGKSPFMDMQLVPVYAGDGADGGITIAPRTSENFGVRTAQVTLGQLSPQLVASANISYDERKVWLVQARSMGVLERLAVRAPFEPVRKGQLLAELFVPDWVAAQEEFLAVARMPGSAADGLAAAARQRMRLAGMEEAQIDAVAASGKVQARVAMRAPASGVVSELTAREGMAVAPGAPLFRINDIDTVWVLAEVPEAIASQVRPGAQVQVRVTSLPGLSVAGTVDAVLPDVNPATRTFKARIVLANPGHRLLPGMFASVALATGARRDVLLIPSEALIETGTRSVVMLADGAGHFRAADVVAGAQANGQTEIVKGLSKGDVVVVSGQFLLDSEANLKTGAARLQGAPK